MKSFNMMREKGKLYSFNLKSEMDDVGPFIFGSVALQVNDKGTIVEGQYYARPRYGKKAEGKPNKTYFVLEDMCAGNYATVSEGSETPDWLEMTGNIDVSYFGPKGTPLKTTDDLVRGQKMRGSFINPNKKKEYTNKWNCDLYIVKIEDIEANPEKGYDELVRVKGYMVNDYYQKLEEVVFEAREPQAMNYIRTLPASMSDPYAVAAWGSLIETKIQSVKKSAFGDDEVQEFDRLTWAITGMSPEPYNFGEEGVMTPEEWKLCKDGLEEFKKASLIKAQSKENNIGGSEKPVLAF